MISLILIILAAVCKAVADTIKHHPDTSIFKLGSFWLKEGKILFGKYKLDGWHIANSVMISSFITSANFPLDYKWYITIPVFGMIFILVFNLFYNKILRK